MISYSIMLIASFREFDEVIQKLQCGHTDEDKECRSQKPFLPLFRNENGGPNFVHCIMCRYIEIGDVEGN